jgi:hypothetical protein
MDKGKSRSRIVNNEEGEIEGEDKETQVGKEDEALPRLTLQNGLTQELLVVFKM